MRFVDKAVVVTGGSSGIGLATARLLVEEGARVAITGRKEEALRAAASALGGGALPVQVDVTDAEALARAFAVIAERMGPLHGVFVNAGIGGPTPLGATSASAFDAIVRTNFGGAFHTAQAALPHVQPGGSLLFNGSVVASLGSPGWSAYAGAKGAVRSMVRVLAAELAPRRIRVNQVTPGATRTPIWSPLAAGAGTIDALEARLAAAAPLGRMAEAADIARAALFLLSDDAAHVTGAELVVDGGASGAPAGSAALRAG